MDQLKDRLFKARERLEISQETLAKRAGVSQSTIVFLENGRNKSSRSMIEIANALGVDPNWLINGVSEEDKLIQMVEPNAEFSGRISEWDDSTPLDYDEVEIPFYKDARLSAGAGAYNDSHVNEERKLRFSKRTLQKMGIQIDKAFCMTSYGDSMKPVIPHNTTVAVDGGCTHIIDGEIYAINNDGAEQIKLLKQISGSKISVESYNPEYEPFIVPASELMIMGRIFWYAVLR